MCAGGRALMLQVPREGCPDAHPCWAGVVCLPLLAQLCKGANALLAVVRAGDPLPQIAQHAPKGVPGCGHPTLKGTCQTESSTLIGGDTKFGVVHVILELQRPLLRAHACPGPGR